MKTRIDYKGFIIEITPTEFMNDSPDDWGNDDCFLVYDHRDFNVQRKGFDPADIFDTLQDKRKLFDNYFYFPVYAYIHSGVSLSLGRSGWPFSCPWDTSFKGFALVRREKGTWNRTKAMERAESLLTTWNDYLSGNVWSYLTEDSKGNTIDSCCGFYGDPETSGLMEQAKDSIDYEIKTRLTTKINKVKTFIKNTVPLEKRMQLITE